MLVEMLIDVDTPSRYLVAGSRVDLPEDEAKALIESEQAKKVRARGKSKPVVGD